MKLVKKILLGLLAFIVLLLVIGLFIQKDYTVEREITINKPKQEVFDYVKSLRNQTNWSTWAKMDPNAKVTFSGTDGAPGSTYAWEGNDKVGKGEQEIKSVTEGQRVDIELRFLEPYEDKSPVWLTTDAVSEQQTKVKWGMSGRFPYPMNLMRIFVSVDKMIGDEYQKSLSNLKGILEAQ